MTTVADLFQQMLEHVHPTQQRMAGDVVQGPWDWDKKREMSITAPKRPMDSRPTGDVIPLQPKPREQG